MITIDWIRSRFWTQIYSWHYAFRWRNIFAKSNEKNFHSKIIGIDFSAHHGSQKYSKLFWWRTIFFPLFFLSLSLKSNLTITDHFCWIYAKNELPNFRSKQIDHSHSFFLINSIHWITDCSNKNNFNCESVKWSKKKIDVEWLLRTRYS